MLKLIPLGGLGEIGINMMVVEYESTIFIIDSGLMFPEAQMLGVKYVIPNMEYLKKNKEKVSAIIITHAHEDHIGSIPYFLKEFNVPVFSSEFTLEIIRHKLKEHNLDTITSLNKISTNKKIKIGPFEINFIQVNHSVIKGLALAIKTPIGVIIHTGDFKIDHNNNFKQSTDLKSFAKYGKRKVLALLSDSTNIEKKGYTIPTKKVTNVLTKLIKNNNGRILLALFSSNISRIKKIIKIAISNKRKILFNGKSLELSVNIARKLEYIKIPKDMEIFIKDINSFPNEKLLIVTTGSQGEPMSALSRIADGNHKQIEIQKGDMVILSSKFIPGNEKAITKIINNLYKKGANVIYEKIANVHVSGHAFREELKFIMHIINPKFLIPIHGEYRHLFLHSKLAQKLGLPKDRIILAKNGQVIKLTKNSFELSKKIKTGRVFVDGKGIGNIENTFFKERQTLSTNGFVAINIAFDEETGIIIYGPEIISKGFFFEEKSKYLLDDAKCVILEIVDDIKHKIPNRMEKIKSRIRNTLRKYFYYTIGKKPIVISFLLEI